MSILQEAAMSGKGTATEEAPNLDAAIAPDRLEAQAAEADSQESAQAESGESVQSEEVVETSEQASGEQATEDSFDESSLQGQTEFSDEEYEKAALHYAKTNKIDPATIDVNNPFTKVLLRENILRGRKISELNQQLQSSADTDEESGSAEEAAETEAQPATDTPEAVQNYLKQAKEFATRMVRPEVATEWVKENISILYGDKAAKQVTPEVAAKIAANQTFGVLMILNDLIPKLLPNQMKQLLGQDYPLLSDIHSTALETRAVTDLKGIKGRDGKPQFPDYAQLEQSGAIARAMTEFPEYRNAVYKDAKTGKPLGPLDSKKREMVTYYQLAKGQAVNPAVVQQAVDKSKAQVKQAAQVAAQGKLAAGASPGSFRRADANDPMTRVLNVGESRWEKAVDAAKVEQKRR